MSFLLCLLLDWKCVTIHLCYCHFHASCMNGLNLWLVSVFLAQLHDILLYGPTGHSTALGSSISSRISASVSWRLHDDDRIVCIEFITGHKFVRSYILSMFEHCDHRAYECQYNCSTTVIRPALSCDVGDRFFFPSDGAMWAVRPLVVVLAHFCCWTRLKRFFPNCFV